MAVLAGATGWSIARLWPTWTYTEMPVPVLTPILLSTFAGGLFSITLKVRSRLKDPAGRRELHPVFSTRTAALALAASRTGAVAMGFYAGVYLVNVLTLDSEASRTAAGNASPTVLVSAVIVALALWLERMCRLPNDTHTETSTNVKQ